MIPYPVLPRVFPVSHRPGDQGGALESGLTGWLLGPVISVVAGGIGTLIVLGLVAVLSPQIRRFGSLQDARPLPLE